MNAQGARGGGGGGRWAVLCALAAAGGVALYLREMEDAVVREAAVAASGAAEPVQVAQVDRALEAMNLVTVILDTRVTAEASDDSWRGEVRAKVTAPVRLMFGTDLSSAKVDVQDLSPLTRTYTVRIATPKRLATELMTTKDPGDVSLGWLRFRTRAGEYYLGQARQKLSDAAAAMVLSEADAAMVRDQTERRVEALVRTVIGPREAERARVVVVVDETLERAAAQPAVVAGEGKRETPR